jgi:hypothetical protein
MSSSSPPPHSSLKGSTTLTALNNLTEVTASPITLPNYHDIVDGRNKKEHAEHVSASNTDSTPASNSVTGDPIVVPAQGHQEARLSEKAVTQEGNSAQTSQPPPFSAFSQRQKWTIVGLSSLAAIFGPVSSNIYVPAIPSVVRDFNTTTQRIDLTLTIYL